MAITLKDAEDLFLKNNYSLLAQKYNVDASKALVRQAGLFNNPNLYYENNVYNKFSGKYFPTKLGTWGDYRYQGEYIVQLNWLFSIAGKRNKAVKVSQELSNLQQFQFDDLVRTLLFALRTDFYNLHYGLESLKLFDEQIISISSIVSGFETQYQKGNVSLREITRVRALLLSIQNDRFDLINNLQQIQKEFSQLLNNSKRSWYKPLFEEREVADNYPPLKNSLTDLINISLVSRPDLLAVQAQLRASQANVNLQKATGVPDIMIQGVFDRNGSYIPNYSGAAIGLPLVIFNRNQGNIQAAIASANSDELELKAKQVNVQAGVYSSYQKMLELEKMYNGLNKNFYEDFKTLLKGALLNYERKNISLLEFVDLYESYKQSIAQYNDIKAKRLNSYEELIFNTGKNVFKQ